MGKKAFIFDLDGVIVDTAKYHYLAWRELANQLGFEFTKEQNEQLKGVSRVRSLEILLGIGNKHLDDDVKIKLLHEKNEQYLKYIAKMDHTEILPGIDNEVAARFRMFIKKEGIKVFLNSKVHSIEKRHENKRHNLGSCISLIALIKCHIDTNCRLENICIQKL